MAQFFSLRTKLRLARSLVTKNQPVYVQYYVTARCNLACEQCNVIYANADAREATTDEAARIAENLARIGVSVVLLTGGEPFARRDLPAIVRAFSSQGIHVRLQTNGLASRDALEACVKAGANDISISLDSLDPGIQDTINGEVRNSWERAIRTMSVVNEIFPGDAFAAFGCVLAPRNFRHVPDVIRFATGIGWWVSLVPAHTTPQRHPLSFRTYDPRLKFPRDTWDEVDRVLDGVHAMREQGMNVYDSDPYMDDMRRMIRDEPVQWRRRNDGVCDSPNLYFAIVPNGSMAVCCDWRMKSRIPTQDERFPEWYRSQAVFDEARSIAGGCGGCLFGSFPEITISSRFLKPMAKRALLFGVSGNQRRLKRMSAQEMLELAAEIRARSPGLYDAPAGASG